MKLGRHTVGEGRVYVVAELGINHQGDMDTARRMIHKAAQAGAHCVKTQMRTLSKVYTGAELAQPRPGIWGDTNGDLKRALELTFEQHDELRLTAADYGLDYTASPWDLDSLVMLIKLQVPWIKIPSPRLGHTALLKAAFESGLPIVLSSGMCSLEELRTAVRVTAPFCIMHCVSQYPQTVRRNERGFLVRDIAAQRGAFYGYSGHERGVVATLDQVAIGAAMVERHVTLDRTMWGSDQKASLTFEELALLVQEIREYEDRRDQEAAYHFDDPTAIHPAEVESRKKLWRTEDL